jgi:glycosyltransferase involved in cell wall biosynthesis
MKPLVSVICLCYNQADYVREAIASVLDQTYDNIQMVVVDDASTDASVSVIEQFLKPFPHVTFLPLSQNIGNCKAFNHALVHARGEFIIDLAADDVLLPERVSKGVATFLTYDQSYGVNFTDAYWIDVGGHTLFRHSQRFPHESIPQGNIYRELVKRFFICSPTMMYRASVIRSLGGYDESLAYEDFDFWIRSSRNFNYCYTPEVLVKKRVIPRSMSHKQFSFFSGQQESTYRVCEKIMSLNRTTDEQAALAGRIRYEVRTCLRLLAFPLAIKYVRLYIRNKALRYPA